MKFMSAWERFYAECPEGENLSDTMEECIQHCKANGIKPTPPFYTARGQVKEREAAGAEYEAEQEARQNEARRKAEQDEYCARYNAELEAKQEAEKARLDALPREEKLVELKAKLADYESWMTPAKEAGKQIPNWALDRKAELERQIAECQEEISLSPEEEAQLLSQFPEACDSPISQEPLDHECQEVAA